MNVYGIDIFPPPDKLSVRLEELVDGSPLLKIDDGRGQGVTVFLSDHSGWDADAYYALGKSLVETGRRLAVVAGRLELKLNEENES